MKTKICLSIDVEDYFMSSHYDSYNDRYKWCDIEIRVSESIKWILSTLKECQNKKITFFVLGIIIERCPELIHLIHSEGHEIALHGFNHLRVTNFDDKQFEFDILRCLKLFDKYSLPMPLGYRAPSFSLKMDDQKKFNILKDYGFIYDSSIFPSRHAHGLPEDPFSLDNGLIEIPLSSVSFLNMGFPLGGGYSRLYGNYMNLYLAKSSNHLCGPQFYFHPWEFESQFYRLPKSILKSFKHTYNTGNNSKLIFSSLVNNFSFHPLIETAQKYVPV